MSSRRFVIGLAASLSAVMIAAPVSAAEPGASRLQTWQAGQKLVACHWGGDKHRLLAALLADPMTGAFEQWAAQRDPTCESAALRPRGDFYRYAVAEAVFRRDLEDVRLQDVASIAPLAHARAPLKFTSRISKKDRDEEAAFQTSAIKLSALGECIVRSDPITAHALLSAKPTSEPEISALTKLLPAVDRCVDQSKATRMGVDELRGAVALNYVRLAKAPGAKLEAAE